VRRDIPNNIGNDGPKALVLSAGGFFAAYQVGVYKALWPYWKPDLVVGASAGALNGWLIAAGLSPDELIAEWFSPESRDTVKFRKYPSVSGGYFDPEPLRQRAIRVHRDHPLKLPLGVVSVEVPRFHPHIFRNHEITPDHLVATCSIPWFYPWVKIDGMRLLDGGLFEPTPVWAAAAMGATSILAINCLPKLTPQVIHLALSSIHRLRKSPLPVGVEVSWITPSGPMGGARDAVVWKQKNVERWLGMGISDGEEFLKRTRISNEAWGRRFGADRLPLST
jgi:NTE family protein